ncbi:hypothetical protein [Natronorubrum daqingense]|uniref:Uncharacterized protein n=1 Tax=Natronorubrum daqingense TaxID=588898 RepID=A0A1N6YD73_9EURY|nr:hypothetical protein [Natronorubrum daqingense]APX95704.1 hypothetical protein BB347_03215 [Natronorubrum daqingense]SIR12439.1 hypothetical protein SAMN05421809_0402 [Natronorubrum daqingense]
MSNRPILSPHRRADDRSPTTAVSRRHLLQGGSVAGILAIAGCLDSLSSGGGDDGDDENDDGDDDGTERTSDDDDDDSSETESDPLTVVDTYFEAAANGDTETISGISHELNPLEPTMWEDEGWEFQGGDGEEPEYDADVRTEDGSVDDIHALEGSEFWFGDVDLETELEGESIAVVEIAGEDEDGEATWILATDDGEWQLLVQGEEDETPDDPEEAFDEPIEDEDEDIVVDVDWEHESETGVDSDEEDDATGGDDELDLEVHQVAVSLTDSPGIDAEAVRAETAIAGSEPEVYSPDREAGGWAGSIIYPTFDPDGDQLEVLAIDGNEETVVHREHYEP